MMIKYAISGLSMVMTGRALLVACLRPSLRNLRVED